VSAYIYSCTIASKAAVPHYELALERPIAAVPDYELSVPDYELSVPDYELPKAAVPDCELQRKRSRGLQKGARKGGWGGHAQI